MSMWTTIFHFFLLPSSWTKDLASLKNVFISAMSIFSSMVNANYFCLSIILSNSIYEIICNYLWVIVCFERFKPVIFLEKPPMHPLANDYYTCVTVDDHDQFHIHLIVALSVIIPDIQHFWCIHQEPCCHPDV